MFNSDITPFNREDEDIILYSFLIVYTIYLKFYDFNIYVHHYMDIKI